MKLVAVAVIVVGLAGCSAPAPRGEAAPETTPAPSGAVSKKDAASKSVSMKVRKQVNTPAAQLAMSCKVTLGQAIATALGRVYGQALAAEVEIENGKPLIDVKIFSNGKIWEVEIDGTTGVVTEVEQEDDDDDDDDEDDDEDGDDD